jgi:predicted transcriptional regulator
MLATKRAQKGIKSDALKLVRDLPGNASWDDLMYRIFVRQKIDAGLADVRAGRVVSHAALRKEFLGST